MKHRRRMISQQRLQQMQSTQIKLEIIQRNEKNVLFKSRKRTQQAR